MTLIQYLFCNIFQIEREYGSNITSLLKHLGLVLFTGILSDFAEGDNAVQMGKLCKASSLTFSAAAFKTVVGSTVALLCCSQNKLLIKPSSSNLVNTSIRLFPDLPDKRNILLRHMYINCQSSGLIPNVAAIGNMYSARNLEMTIRFSL